MDDSNQPVDEQTPEPSGHSMEPNIVTAELAGEPGDIPKSTSEIPNRPGGGFTDEFQRSHPWVSEHIDSAVAKKLARTGSAVCALLLGVIALATSFVSALSLVPAILGIGFGIHGLQSTKPVISIIGGVLCGSAIILGIVYETMIAG